MKLVKFGIGLGCFLISSAWAADSFDATTGIYTGLVQSNGSTYQVNLQLFPTPSDPWRFGLIKATPSSLTANSIYDGSELIILNVGLIGTSQNYAVRMIPAGVDPSGLFTLHLTDAVGITISGTQSSTGCSPPFPTNTNDSWVLSYRTTINGQTGTEEDKLVNNGPAVFNNQSGFLIQQTVNDSSGTQVNNLYVQPGPDRWTLLGGVINANLPTASTQITFNPPITLIQTGLNPGQSSVLLTNETTVSSTGATTSTTSGDGIVFLGRDTVVVPAAPVPVACDFFLYSHIRWRFNSEEVRIARLFRRVSGSNGIPLLEVEPEVPILRELVSASINGAPVVPQ